MSFTLSRASRRDLNLVIVARAVSMLGDQVALVALLLRTQSAGAWPVAALLIAGLAPLVLLAPVVGRLVDRHDSRMLLVISSLGQLSCCLLLAGIGNLAATLVLVTALGVGQAVNSATWQALLPSITGPAGLPRALSRSQAVTTIAAVLAPVIGGGLTGWHGAWLPLLVDAASFAVVTVAAFAVHTRRGRAVTGAAVDRRGGWTVLRADPVLFRLASMLSLFILLGSMVNVVELFLVRQTLHASAGWYGLLGSAWGLGILAGALAGGRLHGQRQLLRVSLTGCALLGVGLAGMGLAPTVGWVLPASLLGGVANGLLNLGVAALIGIRTAEAHRGRVSAIVNGLTSAGQIGAMLLGGLLAATLTPRPIFVLAGALGMAAPALLGPGLLAAFRREAPLAAPEPAADPEPTEAIATAGPVAVAEPAEVISWPRTQNAAPTSSPNSSSGSCR